MPELLVLSCNVRNSGANDGANAWSRRREALCTHLVARSPDLLGTQEVLLDQFDDLRHALPGHHALGVGRDDGDRAGEFAAVFVRRERFDVLAHGTFWLSETPSRIASVGWDAALTRACTWSRLHDRAAGRTLLFANTQFDHVGVVAQLRSAELLATTLPRLAEGAPIVLAGDFNCTEDDAPHRSLVANGGLVDAFRAANPTRQPDEASVHEFAGATRGPRIDWILHSPTLTTKAASIDRTRGPGGTFLSDHDLVDAVLA